MTQRGEAPTGILRSLAAVRRRTVTDLLCDGQAYTIIYTKHFTIYIL